MVLHKDVALGNMHPPYNWVYADSTARLAATGFVPEDKGKFALQEDNSSLWILQDDSPITWASVVVLADGSSGDLQYNDGSGNFTASAVGLQWNEGSDETDSWLFIHGYFTAYSGVFATVVSTPAIQAAGTPLNIVLGDEIQINGDSGAAGQVIMNNGVGNPPTWEDAPGATGIESTDTDVTGWGFVLDEDDMASDDATKLPTQQSVKAYVDAALGGGTYTDEDARDAIGTALVAGNNIDITVSDVGDTITIDVETLTSADITDFNEAAQDTVAGIMTDTSSIAWSYTDGSNQLRANVADEYVMDTIGAMFTDSTNIDVTYNDGGNAETIDLTTAAKTFTINIIIDGGGSVITTGVKGDMVIDPDATVVAWTMLADVSGSAVVDLWQDTYANYPPTNADSITTSEKPTISSSTKGQDTSLNSGSGWDIGGGKTIRWNVDSCSTITRLDLALKCVRD